MFMNYAPLWIKTDYSLLSSLIKIDDLISYLSYNGINTVAICDDNLYGAIEFYDKCVKNNIKPIIGLEVKLDYTILLYAKNYHGYQNLCNINTLISENKLNMDILKKYLDDLVVIIPFECKEHLEEINIFCRDIFIGYSDNKQRELIDQNKVYINKTLTLKKEDYKYLEYLYKIKGEDCSYDDNCFLNLEIDSFDKKTTMYFSNLCNLKISKKDNLLPIFNEEKGFDEKKYLTELCIYGLRKRLNNNVSQNYVKRLKYELDVIIKMGFCNYFLVVWDYVKYAKKNNIMVGPGRGSAASSLVSYSLGITDVDPVKYDLLFERFLNPERVTMPDIDIDFDAEKRNQVTQYVINKYGVKKVSGIITFSNLLSKQVIRDLGRVFNISTYKIDNLVNNFDDKESLKEQLKNVNVTKLLNSDMTLKKLYDVAIHLEGLKRHTSVHAAGIVISSKNLSDYVPLKLGLDGTYLCGYTMNYIEELGLLKMDFLGLKNLSIISKILNKVDINFNDIPLDDKKTYKLFCSGELDGVFQFESSGMKKFIMDLKPNRIDDLIAAVALFRPGPMENISSYILRRHGKEKINYIHDDLKDILESTYGIIIYQEQIMQIASKMAGFSYGEADILRRAMSKKKEDMLLESKEKFISQSVKRGYSKEVATKVYDLILKFANYGFNKAHSVSYAIMGYKIAYLKVHYPLIFMCEILNNYIGIKTKTKLYINLCKKYGIEIVKPNINSSSCNYYIKDKKLVYPLSMIKEIGTLTCNQLIEERNKNGDYTSYLDFIKRNYKLGRNVIRNLILSGSLDIFDLNRKTMIENMDESFNYAELCADIEENFVVKPVISTYPEFSKEELTKHELDLYGFYISNHPTAKYITTDSITADKLDNYFDRNINMILYFEKRREIETKTGEKMMFINASDSCGTVELVMFPKVYNKYFNIHFPGIYKIKGKVEKRFSKLQVVLYEIESLE